VAWFRPMTSGAGARLGPTDGLPRVRPRAAQPAPRLGRGDRARVLPTGFRGRGLPDATPARETYGASDLELPGSFRRFFRLLLPTLVLLVAMSIASEVRRQQPPALSVQLRNDLIRARALADSCTAALAEAEASFRAYNAHVDSLHDAVRGYESLHPAGVPADSYSSYLAAFDSYNVAAAGWQARADSLRASWAACKEVIERHNALADSARRMMEQ